jgi:hypothetical protein
MHKEKKYTKQTQNIQNRRTYKTRKQKMDIKKYKISNQSITKNKNTRHIIMKNMLNSNSRRNHVTRNQ